MTAPPASPSRYCPRCNYALAGRHAEGGFVVCPECGSASTLEALRRTPEPSHPWVEWLLMATIPGLIVAMSTLAGRAVAVPVGSAAALITGLVILRLSVESARRYRRFRAYRGTEAWALLILLVANAMTGLGAVRALDIIASMAPGAS